ncbi:MAG: anthranilate synthase component I [Thermodesulfobacteriota bacterium]|nr:anthranilate synthase component I [Thermodesulfobacteriota bacterium]
MYKPDFIEFKGLAENYNIIPVYREISADLETPVSAFFKISNDKHAFLLESVEGAEKWARYTFLGCKPHLIFKSKDRNVEIIKEGKREKRTSDDPLKLLRNMLSYYRPAEIKGLPRFFGGAVGYISYDMVRFFEKIPDETIDDLLLPDCYFLITDTLLIFDNLKHTIKVISLANIRDGIDAHSLYEKAKEKIERLIDRLREPFSFKPVEKTIIENDQKPLKSNLSKEEFLRIVERAKEYIRAGDIIQVVLSQRFNTLLKVEPFNIYRTLRMINPSPYMFFIKFPEVILLGSSPEILVRCEGDNVEVRPIAGTRPRGSTPEEDKMFEKELKNDPKERAEHVMLVDLGRNDLGRVARAGSIETNELMIIERYSHVMHIVSNVRGIKSEDKDGFDILEAAFPAGTVAGAPKIRAMEIIDELERTKRGPYAGAVGYFSYSGNIDFCITIRTLVIKDKQIYIQAGAGIVADSVPEKEFQETVNKAKGMVQAVKMAEGGLV